MYIILSYPPVTQHCTLSGPGQYPAYVDPPHALVTSHVPPSPFTSHLMLSILSSSYQITYPPHDSAQHSMLSGPGQNPGSNIPSIIYSVNMKYLLTFIENECWRCTIFNIITHHYKIES